MIKPAIISLALISLSASANSWYQPTSNTTWQWQLQGNLNTSYDVDVYDVDLFDTSEAQIQSLQRQNRKVICYFSAGSLENWRDDISAIPEEAIGQVMDGWPDERWLDIRDKQVWRTMQNRLKLAAKKGCDGVEPDNVDAYQNSSGFDLTAEDQVKYNRFLAQSAHILNLSIGLKNSLDLVPQLANIFDFAVNEQCLEYRECEQLKPFISQNKAVFHAEYKSRFDLCYQSEKLGFSTLWLAEDLDDSRRVACQ
jgi:hypothetical protein